MGLVTRLRSGAWRTRQTPGPTDDYWYAPAPWFSMAGVPVTPELVLNLSAVWKAVRMYGDAIGSIPCLLYRRLPAGGKEREPKHPLYDLLRWQPNSWQTAFEFWDMMAGHVVLRGNAYAEIVEGRRGFADQLIPRHPGRMQVQILPNGRLQYQYRTGAGTSLTYSQDQIMHFRGWSDDGVQGRVMTSVAAQSLGAALAADEYAARFFRQGATSSLAVIHPRELGDEGLENLQKSVTRYTAGLERAHGVLALEEDVKLEKLGFEPEKAQVLATREFSVEEIARWTNLPAYALGNTKTPTYASAEAFRRDLVDFSYRPLAGRFEQVIQRDLVIVTDTYFAEFLLDAYLRGDLTTRSGYYHQATGGAAWMSPNEVRAIENLNALPGLDEVRQPLNTAVPESSPAPRRSPERAASGGEGARRTRAEAIVHEAAQRLVRTEIAAATKAAERFAQDAEGWQRWLRTFYDEHAVKVAQVLRLPLPHARAYAAQQGTRLAQGGIVIMADWDWTVTAELVTAALDERGA